MRAIAPVPAQARAENGRATIPTVTVLPRPWPPAQNWQNGSKCWPARSPGKTTDPVVLECSHSIAHAELDLARIRRVKVALIERMLAFGEFDDPLVRMSARQTKKGLNKFVPTGMIPEPVEGALLDASN